MLTLLRRWALALTITGFLAGWLLNPALAGANGVPQLVRLTYLPGVSNFGPQSATGVLEFSFADGYLKLDAAGLARLQNANYQGWLVKSGRNDAISVGIFNAQADGSVSFETTLPVIDDFGYDLFLLTVEDDPDLDPVASGKRSIGGFFSVVNQPRVAVGSGQTQSGPATLPDTGDANYLPSLLRGAVMAGAVALALGLVGISLVTRKRRAPR